MGFHEIQFPTNLSYGSSGGPGFKTDIIVTDSGAEQRVSKWAAPRRRYNAAYSIKTYSDLFAVQKFYIGRLGAANGFRFKDFMDMSSAANSFDTSIGGDAVDYDDVQIGIGNSTTTTFQLIKTYVSGLQTRTRTINKPVTGTVRIGVNGSEVVSGWTVNTETGVITFTVPPTSGHVITAGFEFDVPVRFEKELDDLLSINIEDFGSGNVPDIPLIEILEPELRDEEFYYGGGSEIEFSDDYTIMWSSGRAQKLSPTTSGLFVFLPDDTDVGLGGPFFYIENGGADDFDLRDNADTYDVATVTAGAKIIVLRMYDSGNKWVAIQ